MATFMSSGGTICGQYLKSQFSGSKTFPLLIVQGTREDLIRISSLPLFYDRSFFVTMIKTGVSLKSLEYVFSYFISISNNLAPDGEREFRTQSAQNYGDKMTLFTKTVKVLIIFQELRLLFHLKVDKYKHDNLKISKEKLDTLSLSGNDFVGHVKRHHKTEKPGSKDNLKLATGKIEDETTSSTQVKVLRLLMVCDSC